MSQSDFSTKGLLDFLDLAESKGWMAKGTTLPMRSSCTRVFSVLDEKETHDVRGIDLDSAIRRFANLNPAVASQSLRDYKSRIGRAVELFVKHREDPASWKPPAGRAQKGPVEAKPPRRDSSTPKGGTATTAPFPSPTPTSGFAYPFPLRPDLTIMISNVPRDLKLAEADRIAALLRALAEDFKP